MSEPAGNEIGLPKTQYETSVETPQEERPKAPEACQKCGEIVNEEYNQNIVLEYSLTKERVWDGCMACLGARVQDDPVALFLLNWVWERKTGNPWPPIAQERERQERELERKLSEVIDKDDPKKEE